MSLYFITGSKGKFTDVQNLIPEVKQLDIDLPEIQELDPRKIIEEKVKHAFAHHEGTFIIDDTSLMLSCLRGLPGPFIKWFLEKMGVEGLYNITHQMKDNKATALTLIGYAKSQEDIQFFAGEVKGTIVKPRGEGFGWSTCFLQEGQGKTYGEMSLAEKNEVSMRSVALRKLIHFLDEERA